ncbi:hypothetical protein PLANPX_5505 [Lacipirellula parvula]|uniref:Uncharacterized protein n=1 Tax=Lacipirellula parvula TaxID=2650471 RepID=A0A5K7XMM1_9BACT|nr:hypothetical protein PLANPX_5505 [Lacipirellula parvula]
MDLAGRVLTTKQTKGTKKEIVLLCVFLCAFAPLREIY